MSDDPLYLTYKLQIASLLSVLNIYDFQLRDHLRTNNDLYYAKCCGAHKHMRSLCYITNYSENQVDTNLPSNNHQTTKKSAPLPPTNGNFNNNNDDDTSFISSSASFSSSFAATTKTQQQTYRSAAASDDDPKPSTSSADASSQHSANDEDGLYVDDADDDDYNTTSPSSSSPLPLLLLPPPSKDHDHRLVIPFESLLFHQDLTNHKLYECSDCSHMHSPPCLQCINCKLMKQCMIQKPFRCNFTSSFACPNLGRTTGTGSGTNRVHKNIKNSQFLYEHVFNLRNPLFYICHVHKHRHMYPSQTISSLDCIIQSVQCCDSAVHVLKLAKSFMITTTNIHTLSIKSLDGFQIKKSYILYDPQIWRGQSTNFALSFLRGVIANPKAADNRYKRYHSSSFVVPNIKKYISGKESGARQAITGFDTTGMYQTSTISPILDKDTFLIPQILYKLLNDKNKPSQMLDETPPFILYALKRDPAYTSTCMYILKGVENPDPTTECFVINAYIATLLHQDQDGDKNAVYSLNAITSNSYYNINLSFNYKLSKLELVRAHGNFLTTTALSRYDFSEHNVRMLALKQNEISEKNELVRRYYERGPKFLIELGCGYMRDELAALFHTLVEINKRPERDVFTMYDLSLLDNPNSGCESIVKLMIQSGLTQKNTVQLFLNKLIEPQTLMDMERPMIDQMNRYITSGKDLKINGRKEFAILYNSSDIVSMAGLIFYNKLLIYNFINYPSSILFSIRESSFIAFIDDLEDNYNKKNNINTN